MISGTNLLVIKPSDITALDHKAPARGMFSAAGAVSTASCTWREDTTAQPTPPPAGYHWRRTWSALAARQPAVLGQGRRLSGKLYVAGGWTTAPGFPATCTSMTRPPTPGGKRPPCPTLGSPPAAYRCDQRQAHHILPATATTATPIFSTSTTRPTPGQLAPSATCQPGLGVIDNKFYVAGGIDNNSVSAVLEVYDPRRTPGRPRHRCRSQGRHSPAAS